MKRSSYVYFAHLALLTLALGACGDDGGATTPDAAQADAMPDSTPDGPDSTPMVLSNSSLTGCTAVASVGPVLPDEAGHLATSKLTPPSYPFQVTSIAYDLVRTETDDLCDELLAHRVELYVTTNPAPTASPSADGTRVATIDVPVAASATGTERLVELELDTPIELTTGEHLFVGIQLAADTDVTRSICVASCADAGGSGNNFWSNADAEPYDWQDLVDDFGFEADYTIRAVGTAR